MYIPLHHKYRPQTFAELVGQEAISQTLTNAIINQKIAPAYLFTGLRGTGKTSSARILAKSLNCFNSQKPTITPCGECESCRSIRSGISLDVVELDAASNSGVDNIRDIIEKAQFAPIKGRYKVYLIDEAHALTGTASQALLKTLEEPPKRVIFILCTTEPQKLPNTIISRCQRFNFRRITTVAMVSHLQQIATKEKICLEESALKVIAKLSQGGMRDAETLLDQLSLLEQTITPEVVYDLVGNVPEIQLFELVKAINSENINRVLLLIREIIEQGKEPLVILQNLTAFYTDLLMAKSSINSLNLEDGKALSELAIKMESSYILAVQQHLRQCENQIKFNSQPALWLEVAILGLLPSVLLNINVNKTSTFLNLNSVVNQGLHSPVLSKF